MRPHSADGKRGEGLRRAADGAGVCGPAADGEAPVVHQVYFTGYCGRVCGHVLRLAPVHAERVMPAADGCRKAPAGCHASPPPLMVLT